VISERSWNTAQPADAGEAPARVEPAAEADPVTAVVTATSERVTTATDRIIGGFRVIRDMVLPVRVVA
jgi:hypothetical protein